MSHIQRFHRRKQINQFLIEQNNHIQSIGDTPIIHDLFLFQPSRLIDSNDCIYLIYLLLLIMLYIYYMKILLINQNDDNYQDRPLNFFRFL